MAPDLTMCNFDVVAPGQSVADHLNDYTVGTEGAGIVCIEVKVGEVWHADRGWLPDRGDRIHEIEPLHLRT